MAHHGCHQQWLRGGPVVLLVLLISVMVGATTVDIIVSGRFEQDARLADQVCLCSFGKRLQAIEHYRRLECEEGKKERKKDRYMFVVR
jgi:hypothetical protein